MSSSPAELVRAAADGDRDAFRVLVEQSWVRLVRLARSVVGELEAEDVVQEGLMVVWNKLPHLANPDSFAAWTGRIVFRRCLRRIRRRRVSVPIESVAESSYRPDPAAEVDAWRLLSRLAPRQRAVLHLTVVEGMTDAEIGTLMGITAGSVRAHRRRARDRVAAILAGSRP